MLEVNLRLNRSRGEMRAIRAHSHFPTILDSPFGAVLQGNYMQSIFNAKRTEGVFKAVNQPFRAEMAAIKYGA